MIVAEFKVQFDRLPAIAEGLQPAVEGLVKHELAVAQEEARAAAPVRTGELRDSILVVWLGDAWALVAGAAHAMLVELGTRLVPARPFLAPAFRRAFARIGARLPAVLGRLAR